MHHSPTYLIRVRQSEASALAVRGLHSRRAAEDLSSGGGIGGRRERQDQERNCHQVNLLAEKLDWLRVRIGMRGADFGCSARWQADSVVATDQLTDFASDLPPPRRRGGKSQARRQLAETICRRTRSARVFSAL